MTHALVLSTGPCPRVCWPPCPFLGLPAHPVHPRRPGVGARGHQPLQLLVHVLAARYVVCDGQDCVIDTAAYGPGGAGGLGAPGVPGLT